MEMKIKYSIIAAFGLLTTFGLSSKESATRNNSFTQTKGWPDISWLKDLQVAVEESLKKNISLAESKKISPSLKEVETDVSKIFEKNYQELEKVIKQLEITFFDQFEIDLETKDLSNWLVFLSAQLKELREGITQVLSKYYFSGADKRVWLFKPERIQLDLRKQFILFFNKTVVWASQVPDLVKAQICPDHNLIIEKDPKQKCISLEAFINYELPELNKVLEILLQKSFRENKPESRDARLNFYNIAVRLSQTIRYFEFTEICSISNDCYQEIYNFMDRFGNALICSHNQFKYDEDGSYSPYVKRCIWISFYWFYNIFPYKNFPWKDENCLKIENLFKQVSTTLDLGAPYTFSFNIAGRHMFKNPPKK